MWKENRSFTVYICYFCVENIVRNDTALAVAGIDTVFNHSIVGSGVIIDGICVHLNFSFEK